MNVCEEDRPKNNGRGLGIAVAAAAIGVGIGGALYYFLSKPAENPIEDLTNRRKEPLQTLLSLSKGRYAMLKAAYSKKVKRSPSPTDASLQSATHCSVPTINYSGEETMDAEEVSDNMSDESSVNSYGSDMHSDYENGNNNTTQMSIDYEDSDSSSSNDDNTDNSDEDSNSTASKSDDDEPSYFEYDVPDTNDSDATYNDNDDSSSSSDSNSDNDDAYSNNDGSNSGDDSNSDDNESNSDSNFNNDDDDSNSHYSDDSSRGNDNSNSDSNGQDYSIDDNSNADNDSANETYSRSVQTDESARDTNYANVLRFTTSRVFTVSDSDDEWDLTNSSADVPYTVGMTRVSNLSRLMNVLPSIRNSGRRRSKASSSVNGNRRFRERTWSLEECSICFEIMLKDQQLTMLPCSHNFHAACIQRWLDERQTCPNCRKNAA